MHNRVFTLAIAASVTAGRAANADASASDATKDVDALRHENEELRARLNRLEKAVGLDDHARPSVGPHSDEDALGDEAATPVDTAPPLIAPTLLAEVDYRVFPSEIEGNTGFALARLRPGVLVAPADWFRGVATIEFAGEGPSILDATGIIELAIDWTLTETPYLGRDGHMPSPQLLYDLYKGEFDGAYKEGTIFILTLHPFISGHRAPMEHLDRFVAYMKSKPGVWFATCAQVAQYLKEQNTW